MSKISSIVDQLPQEAQSEIIRWLECHPARTVVEMIARKPPEGFGVQTHVTTLRRFYARQQATSRPADLEIAKLFASYGSEEPLNHATDMILSEWAFQIATNPRRTTNAFKALSRWSLRQKEQKQRDSQIEVSRKRLSLERDKFEFNAARQALLHHDRLGKILGDQDFDDEQKINAARDQLFGKGAQELDKIAVDAFSENPSDL